MGAQRRTSRSVDRDVGALLLELSAEAEQAARAELDSGEKSIGRAESQLTQAEAALRKSRDQDALESRQILESARSTLENARVLLRSKRYEALLHAQAAAREAAEVADSACQKAVAEERHYRNRRGQRVQAAVDRIPKAFLMAFVYGLAGIPTGCVASTVGGLTIESIRGRGLDVDAWLGTGLIGGFVCGFLIGLFVGAYEMERELGLERGGLVALGVVLALVLFVSLLALFGGIV